MTLTNSSLQTMHKQNSIEITTENMLVVKHITSNIFDSITRLENEYVYLSTQLNQLQQVLGEQFYEYVKTTFNLQPRVVKRLLSIDIALREKLNDGKTIDLTQAKQFNKGALYLISGVTDTDVLDEIKSLAKDGTKITESIVNEIIQSRNVAYEEQITLAQAEATRANKKLEEVINSTTLELAKKNEQLAKQNILLQRNAEKTQSLEEEVDTLRKQSIEVKYEEKLVPTLPPEFSNLEEAIQAQKKKMHQIQSEYAENQKAVVEITRQKQELQSSLESLKDIYDDYQQIQATANTLIQKFSHAKFLTLHKIAPQVRENLIAYGTTMIELGTHLVTNNK